MVIVDTHVHYWEAERPDRPYAPDGVMLSAPITVEEMVAEMDAAGIDAIIQVTPQVMGYDNRYSLEGAARYPDRIRVFGRFDVLAPAARDRLARWRDSPYMIGIRLTMTAPGLHAWLRESAGGQFWAAAEELAIPVAIIAVGEMRTLGGIAARHPRLRLFIDHMGAAFRRVPDYWVEEEDVVALARHANVAVKVSAIPEHSLAGYPFRDTEPHIRRLYDAFGPERLLWGSNFPPSRDACPLRDSVTFFREWPWLAERERDLIMGGNAVRLLGLPR